MVCVLETLNFQTTRVGLVVEFGRLAWRLGPDLIYTAQEQKLESSLELN